MRLTQNTCVVKGCNKPTPPGFRRCLKCLTLKKKSKDSRSEEE
jgi:hypothetical protein